MTDGSCHKKNPGDSNRLRCRLHRWVSDCFKRILKSLAACNWQLQEQIGEASGKKVA